MSNIGLTEWEYVTKAAEKIIEANMKVKDVQIWFVSGAVNSGKDTVMLMAKVIKDDGTELKIDKEVEREAFMEMKTPKDVAMYAVIFLAQYIVLLDFNEILR